MCGNTALAVARSMVSREMQKRLNPWTHIHLVWTRSDRITARVREFCAGTNRTAPVVDFQTGLEVQRVMAWQLLDTAQLADGMLELYRQGDVFMIRANGLELMNGLAHQSEAALGELAVHVARNAAPRILIGGLGLGYTLAATARALRGAGSITVAELSPAVIAWFDRYVAPSVLPIRPPNLSIVAADVGDLVRAGAEDRYDAIVLDVDNGPEALVSPRNARLYGPEGLHALSSRLVPNGVILLWSGFEAPDFAALAEREGFSVTCKVLASVGRTDLLHYAYVLSPPRDAAGGK